MANANMPLKKLQVDERDDTTVIDDIVKKYTERAIKANARLAKGFLDAPCIEEAVMLGYEGVDLENGAPKDPYDAPIYKINVPGYFYRQHYTGDWDSDTVAGVLVADTPNGMVSSSTRFVYMAGSDGSIGHANNMFPILPGESTYAYIVRNPSMRARNSKRAWLFIPTVLGASVNVRPEDYVSVVGGPNALYELTGSMSVTGLSSVFSGDWKTLFKSVCGWNVADEAKMTFLSPAAKDKFIADRVSWIKGLGARLSDYKYTEPST